MHFYGNVTSIFAVFCGNVEPPTTITNKKEQKQKQTSNVKWRVHKRKNIAK